MKLLILAAFVRLQLLLLKPCLMVLRTLSNTTRVTDSENQLLALGSEREKTLKLKELQEKSIEELTKDLRIQMDELVIASKKLNP